MPLTQVKEYLTQLLQLDQLFADVVLVQKLEQILDGYRSEKSEAALRDPSQHASTDWRLRRLHQSKIDAKSLIDLPGFSNLNPERRETLRQSFQQAIEEHSLRLRPSLEKAEELQVLGQLERVKSSLQG
jgi:G3E family GTPase